MLIESASSASFVMQFQGIKDFREENFFQPDFYPEIRAYMFYRIWGSYYNFCIEPRETCVSGYAEVSPTDFTHPVRVVIPLSLIREAIQRYASGVRIELSSAAVYEIVPEFKEGVENPPERIIFGVSLKSVAVREERILGSSSDGVPCFQRFPHFFVAVIEVEISASVGGGKDIFVEASFSIPITVDLISWIPDVRFIQGENPLKRSTPYVVFGRCGQNLYPSFYYEAPYMPMRTIEEIKRKKDSIQGILDFDARLKRILGHVTEVFLSGLDFRPITFPIVVLAFAGVKKAYLAELQGERALALELDNKGIDALPQDPYLRVIKVPNRTISSRFVEVRVGGDDKTEMISFSLNGGVWSEWIRRDERGFFSFVVTDLLQGVHTIRIIGQNIYGNINEQPVEISFLVDRTPPDLDVFIPRYSNEIKAHVLARDNSGQQVNVEVIVLRDGRQVVKKNYSLSGTFVISEKVKEGGYYDLLFRATDLCGNSHQTISKTILVDTMPPKIRLVNIPKEKINVESLEIMVEIEDDMFPYGTISYYIEEMASERRRNCFSVWGVSDSVEIKEPYGHLKFTGLEGGKRYFVCVQASDPAGNLGEVEEFEFQVDKIPPKVYLKAFPPRVTYDTFGYIEVFAEDDLSLPEEIQFYFDFSFSPSISRVLRQERTLRIFLDNLPDGKFKFSVYAKDAAGNVSNFEEKEFIVDTTLRRFGGGGIRIGCQAVDVREFALLFLILIFYRRRGGGFKATG